MESQPLVSVLTPFFNTARYLGECIESVLRQTYDRFEYLLVDNKSTDESRRIAERYAARDPRIKVLENERFVDQLTNYNGALTRISRASKYTKIVQADDKLYPECIARMVALAESQPSVGLVSSYYLSGDRLQGAGIPHDVTVMPGREACRLLMLNELGFTGSQTTVLYRSDLVRARDPFYTPGHYHSDTETAIEIMLEHDLGFVHQVLSFSRAADDDSISAIPRKHYNWMQLHFYMLAERYGHLVFDKREGPAFRTRLRRAYYQCLGREALRLPGRGFWEYHRRGLATVGQELRWRHVWPWTMSAMLALAANPQRTVAAVLREVRTRRGRGARR
jgi:glycosyltransferase involved in cell wall biosynthesis